MNVDFLPFGFYDLIEIIIMATIVYHLIITLRSTRAAQVLLGLFGVGVVWVASRELGFETIFWIINSLFSSFLIFVIIIFQDDIRRLLTTFGSGGFVTGLEEESGSSIVNEVIRAAKSLSHERLGALIVFERSINTDKIYTHAVPLKALVTEQLLVSIFHSFSPLHDGAVIIKKSKIECASAHLPLTKNPRLGKKHGTRHSAAIGISEQADVVVLVVSEETGAISIALNGELRKQASAVEAERRLIELLVPKKKVSSTTLFLERWFFSPFNYLGLWAKDHVEGESKYIGGERRKTVRGRDSSDPLPNEENWETEEELKHKKLVLSRKQMKLRFPGSAPSKIDLKDSYGMADTERLLMNKEEEKSSSKNESVPSEDNKSSFKPKTEKESRLELASHELEDIDDESLDLSSLTQVEVGEPFIPPENPTPLEAEDFEEETKKDGSRNES